MEETFLRRCLLQVEKVDFQQHCDELKSFC
jgi:hypothetical protein